MKSTDISLDRQASSASVIRCLFLYIYIYTYFPIWLSNISELSVPNGGYSRNASRTLKLISTVFFSKHRKNVYNNLEALFNTFLFIPYLFYCLLYSFFAYTFIF